MYRFTASLLAVLWAAAVPVMAQETIVGPRPQAMDDRFIMEPPGIRVETWASGLVAPWSLVFLPDGQALVSERNGSILLVERDGGLVELSAVNIWEDDESGLMGIAIHPDFPDPAFVYAMYTWWSADNTGNTIARFRLDGYRLADGGIPADNPFPGLPI